MNVPLSKMMSGLKVYFFIYIINLLIGASLLALAKSIYYYTLNHGTRCIYFIQLALKGSVLIQGNWFVSVLKLPLISPLPVIGPHYEPSLLVASAPNAMK